MSRALQSSKPEPRQVLTGAGRARPWMGLRMPQFGADHVGKLPEALAGPTMEFGTDSPDVFLSFLEGYDALNYVQQSNGAVAREFNPQASVAALLDAVEKDPDFEGPYHVLVQLCRQCAA